MIFAVVGDGVCIDTEEAYYTTAKGEWLTEIITWAYGTPNLLAESLYVAGTVKVEILSIRVFSKLAAMVGTDQQLPHSLWLSLSNVYAYGQTGLMKAIRSLLDVIPVAPEADAGASNV